MFSKQSRRKSVMKNRYTQAPSVSIPRSSFNRSSGHKTTMDADWLVPVFCDDVIPGDTFNMNAIHFARLATPVFPLMDNLHLDLFWFFVPYRILWTNFVKMHGEQENPDDSIDFVVPAVDPSTNKNIQTSALCDYFGLPFVTSADTSNISALPFRAYNRIWNDWFRAEALQDSIANRTGDGPDSLNDYPMQKRGKRHDYFTSALPAPQRGEAVDLPLGTTAPIHTPGAEATNVSVFSDAENELRLLDAPALVTIDNLTGTAGNALYANLNDAGAATINDWRLALQTQALLERDARAGTRYISHIKAHFGVDVPDFRLQRPEFLGAASTAVDISPVPNTFINPGVLGAFGTAGGRSGFTKSFDEHGVVMGLANLRADITYQQGLNRMWSRKTRFDFAYPMLANIGEQAILNQEIYYDNVDGLNTDVFGYTERFNEYRDKPSIITGLFRSQNPATLDPWHLSEEFTSRPALGATFIQSNTPVDRIIAVPSQPHVYADFHFGLRCARPLPVFGIPGNLGRM